MAFSKAHLFATEDYHLSLVCHALGHPARVQILRKLLKQGRCTVKEICESIPLNRVTISQHLRILRELRVVCCEQSFPTVIYWVNGDLPETMYTLIEFIFRYDASQRAAITFELAEMSSRRIPAVEAL